MTTHYLVKSVRCYWAHRSIWKLFYGTLSRFGAVKATMQGRDLMDANRAGISVPGLEYLFTGPNTPGLYTGEEAIAETPARV